MALGYTDARYYAEIAAAIRARNGSDAAYTPAEMAQAILDLPSGVDTSDATAGAGDILAGKTAYADGKKLTGTIPERAAATVTPGAAARVIPAGIYLAGAQTVAGDENLAAGNIRSGVSIFGVAGTYGADFCTVTAAVSPAGAGTVTGAGSVQAGMTVTLTASAGAGYAFLRWEADGETVATGSSYTFTVTEDVTVTAVCVDVSGAYLSFVSGENFTLATFNRAMNWNGTLEWSTDGESWATWSGTTTLSSVNGLLYLRGTGNTYLTTSQSLNDAKWVLTGSEVGCYGSIEYLLDYETAAAGGHTTMAGYCFSYLFYGCEALTHAPELPTETLATYCYSFMFYDCTGLTEPPALPATTLATYCYNYMFCNCAALTQLPALPATALKQNCYYYMFGRCSEVKVSATQTDEYRYPFRIPTEGTGTMATGALTYIFTGTGGTFTGTPGINTTYYTTAEPIV